MEIIEIPFGAKDSELQEWEYTIPDGMEAEIRDGKVIIKKKKSEDERIGNVIYCIVRDNKDVKRILEGNGVSVDNALAYLEKQKINTEGDFGRGYDCGYKACLNSHGAEFFEKQKEPTTEELYAEAGTTEKEYIANTMKMVRAMREKQKEQKPAEWSEEDEHRYGDAIYFLETTKMHYADTSEIELAIDWLKSLRPQPKVEWSVLEEPVDLEETVEFECIGKKVKMTVQELINYYIDSECVDVADKCGF